jgi:hypothetical protein
MPNQRAKTKTYLGGFVERDFKDKISEFAREAGMEHNQFGFVLRLIQGPLNRRKATRAATQPNQEGTLPAVAAPNGAYAAGAGQGSIVIPAAQHPAPPAPRAY